MESLSPYKSLNHSFRREASSGSSPMKNGGGGSGGGEKRRQLITKVLFNVNIQNSLGPVQVMMLPENTVGELMKAAIAIYVNDRRRPLLPSTDPASYQLHYSPFSLQSLKIEEKLTDLGSRNFFLCLKSGSAKQQ